MKIVVDLEACEGHGRCYDNAYELFDEGPDGKTILKMTDVADDDFEMHRLAQSAVMMCPKIAISIVEDD